MTPACVQNRWDDHTTRRDTTHEHTRTRASLVKFYARTHAYFHLHTDAFVFNAHTPRFNFFWFAFMVAIYLCSSVAQATVVPLSYPPPRPTQPPPVLCAECRRYQPSPTLSWSGPPAVRGGMLLKGAEDPVPPLPAGAPPFSFWCALLYGAVSCRGFCPNSCLERPLSESRRCFAALKFVC